jgi:hypothetical protein
MLFELIVTLFIVSISVIGSLRIRSESIRDRRL